MKESKFFNTMGPCEGTVHYVMRNECAVADVTARLRAGGLFWYVGAKGTGKSTFWRQCFALMGSSRTVICLNLGRRDGEAFSGFRELLISRLYEAFYLDELLHPSKKLVAWIKMQKIGLGEQLSELDAAVWFKDMIASCTKPVVIVLEDVDWLINEPAYKAFVRDVGVNAALGRYQSFALLLTGCHKVLPEGEDKIADVQMDDVFFSQTKIGFDRLPLVLKYDTDMIRAMLLQAGVEATEAKKLSGWLYEMTGGHAGLIVKIIQGMVMDHEIQGDEDWSPECGMRSIAGILKNMFSIE